MLILIFQFYIHIRNLNIYPKLFYFPDSDLGGLLICGYGTATQDEIVSHFAALFFNHHNLIGSVAEPEMEPEPVETKYFEELEPEPEP